ncbi:hypothetical protein [Paenibacillus ehimensis]|uniref:hypothetical protein n=1 Tax=Paenibacillus ehimensis TaxID=79264 RepID=UPI00046FFFF7|nr:hypothetical protein [Paenibacillus ehimensis]
MKFKDMLLKDLSVFFNLDEHADLHNIDGRDIPVIIDGDQLTQRPRQPIDLYHAAAGVFVAKVTIYAYASDFEERPVIGQHLRLDGQLRLVTNCTESSGILVIDLEANEA